MARDGRLYRVFAIVALLFACIFYPMFLRALRQDGLFAPVVTFGWVSLDQCVDGKPAFAQGGKPITTKLAGLFPFYMHIFFMSLGFGLFAPLAAITYGTLEALFGVPHGTAKAVHGALNLTAALLALLGFAEIYIAHSCAVTHFLSVHSWIGFTTIVGYVLNSTLALAVLTNTRVLRANSRARRTFVQYHRFVGTAVLFLGFVAIASGTLLYTGKKGDHSNAPTGAPALSLDGWWRYADAIGVLIGLALALALMLFEGGRDSAGPAGPGDKGVVEVLVPALTGPSDSDSPDKI